MRRVRKVTAILLKNCMNWTRFWSSCLQLSGHLGKELPYRLLVVYIWNIRVQVCAAAFSITVRASGALALSPCWGLRLHGLCVQEGCACMNLWAVVSRNRWTVASLGTASYLKFSVALGGQLLPPPKVNCAGIKWQGWAWSIWSLAWVSSIVRLL